MKRIGIVTTKTDLCALVSVKSENKTYIVIYVHNGLIVLNSESRICEILKILDREFEIKMLEVNLFVGIEIKTQKSYLIKKYEVYQSCNR